MLLLRKLVKEQRCQVSNSPSGVGGSTFASDSRESDGQGSLGARFEHLGLRVLGDVVGDLQVAEGASPLGVDHTLRDPLAVEVSDAVDVVCVLDKKGSSGTDRKRRQGHASGGAMPEG